MQEAIKAEHEFLGMDTDHSPKSKDWGLGSYDFGLNIRVGSSEQGNTGAVENIQGNTLVSFSLPAGTNDCVGTHGDIATNSIFYCNWNSNGDHGIYKYNVLTNSISKIFPIDETQPDILGFDQNSLITGMGYVNNQLYFTDNNQPQRKINVVDALTYPVPYIEAYIDFVKIPPTVPITCVSQWVDATGAPVLYKDAPTAPNFMSNRSFQFDYRYIYKDHERSVWSVKSLLIPTGYGQDLKNKIILTIDNTEVNDAVHYSPIISFIEIGFRDGNSTEFGDAVPFKLMTRIPFPTSNGPVTFDFYNDQAYPVIDPLQTAKFFDSVPFKSKGLALAKSRIFLGNNTEGFAVTPSDFSVSNIVNGVISAPVSNHMYYLSGGRYSVGIAFYDRADRKSGAQKLFSFSTDERHGPYKPNTVSFTLSGLPPVRATHWQVIRTACKNKSYFIQVLVDIVSQTSEQVVIRLNNSNSANVAYNFTEGDRCNIISYKSGEVALPVPQDNLQVVGQSGDDITVKWTKGSNPSLQNGAMIELYSPALSTDVELYYEVGQIYPVINPGLSNRRFGNDNSSTGKNILLGQGNDTGDKTGDIHYRDVTKPVDLLANVYPFSEYRINTGQNIGPLTIIVTYSFNVNGTTYINSQTIPHLGFLNPEAVALDIVTQIIAANRHDIVVVSTSSTSFKITSTTRGFSTFFVTSTVTVDNGITVVPDPGAVTLLSSLSPTQASINDISNNLEAMASNDDFFENWQKNVGRSNIQLLENEREIVKFSSIRFGGLFVQDTQINGLSSFNALDQSTLPIEFGPINKLQVAANNQAEGSVMLSIHSNEIASIYIEQVTFKQAAGGQSVALTDDVIGSVNPFGKGIGSINPETIKQIDGRVYGYDLLRGIAWRYAQNGLDSIGEIGKKNYFFQKSRDLLPLGAKIFGAIDPYHNEFSLTFMPNDEDIEAETISWSENNNRWTTYYSFIGEFYEKVNTKLISFKDGELWLHNSNSVHNNFYGIQYTSKLKPVCFQEPKVMKILQRVEMISQDLWNAIDIATPEGQSSELIGLRDPLTAYTPPQDFWRFEESFSGNVMRDKNTPNETYPLLNGDYMRSQIFTVLLECAVTTSTALFYVNLYYIYSQKTNR